MTTTVEEVAAKLPPVGALQASLDRNSKQIRSDRAEQISQDTQLRFRRMIEDAILAIRNKERNRNSMLDLSPDSALSIISAKNYDPNAFVDDWVKLSLEIAKGEENLAVLKQQYKVLFGKEFVNQGF